MNGTISDVGTEAGPPAVICIIFELSYGEINSEPMQRSETLERRMSLEKRPARLMNRLIMSLFLNRWRSGSYWVQRASRAEICRDVESDDGKNAPELMQ